VLLRVVRREAALVPVWLTERSLITEAVRCHKSRLQKYCLRRTSEEQTATTMQAALLQAAPFNSDINLDELEVVICGHYDAELRAPVPNYVPEALSRIFTGSTPSPCGTILCSTAMTGVIVAASAESWARWHRTSSVTSARVSLHSHEWQCRPRRAASWRHRVLRDGPHRDHLQRLSLASNTRHRTRHEGGYVTSSARPLTWTR
jgi:hypothetical protein